MNQRVLSAGLVVAAVGILSGCPMSSTWTPPRAIPVGTTSHTIGVETLAFVGREATDLNEDGDTADLFEDSGTILAPLVFPAYIFRIGVADRFDIGLKGSTGGAFQADFKVQLVKTPAFDLALDPAIQLSVINYATLPVLFGFNGGESFSVYLGPRATWVFLFADDATLADGFAVGGSLGFRIALSPRISLYPEVAWLRSLAEGANGHMVTAGLGFSFGAGQPEYGPGSIEYVQE